MSAATPQPPGGPAASTVAAAAVPAPTVRAAVQPVPAVAERRTFVRLPGNYPIAFWSPPVAAARAAEAPQRERPVPHSVVWAGTASVAAGAQAARTYAAPEVPAVRKKPAEAAEAPQAAAVAAAATVRWALAVRAEAASTGGQAVNMKPVAAAEAVAATTAAAAVAAAAQTTTAYLVLAAAVAADRPTSRQAPATSICGRDGRQPNAWSSSPGSL